jgi:hypothetical protein
MRAIPILLDFKVDFPRLVQKNFNSAGRASCKSTLFVDKLEAYPTEIGSYPRESLKWYSRRGVEGGRK